MVCHLRQTVWVWGLLLLMWALPVRPVSAQAVQGDVLLLTPGNARSITYEFNSLLGEAGGSHLALIVASIADSEIHRLTVDITPVGDVGPEIAYISGGLFLGSLTGFVSLFEPRFTYGNSYVTYGVDVYPPFATGFLLTAAAVRFGEFDFPLKMAMTVTLSN